MKKIIVGIVFVLMLTMMFSPFVSVKAAGNRVNHYNWYVSKTEFEIVPADTDLLEYVNSKKHNVSEGAEYNADWLTFYGEFDGIYKYPKAEDGLTFKFRREETIDGIRHLYYDICYTQVIVIPNGTAKYPIQNVNIINSYNISSNTVTIYIGNVTENGISRLKYMFSDSSVNTETLEEIRKILPEDYAALLPTTEGEFAVCNDNSITVDESFFDARVVANRYFEGTVTNTSNNKIYNQVIFLGLVGKTQSELVDENRIEDMNLKGWNIRKVQWDADEQEKVEQAESYGEEYFPLEFPEEYVKAFNDSTTYPLTSYFIADDIGEKYTGYIIRNGVMTQVDNYPINRTIVKIVNTSANVENESQVLKGDLDKNNVVDANDASVALELYKAQSATQEDILIGDMDQNNLIDANDASLILEYYKTHQ